MIDSFIAEILADNYANINEYLHTTTLADVIRNGKNKLDAIVYPGVESVGAKNYAIHADSLIKFNIPDIYLLEIKTSILMVFMNGPYFGKETIMMVT